MTLVINTTIPEGQILAADSRQTYTNKKGQVRIGSENASKIFQLSETVGAATSGMAFLEGKNISQQIKEFLEAEKELKGKSVEDIAKLLFDFFSPKYQALLREIGENVKRELENQGNRDVGYEIDKNIVKFKFKDKDGNVESKDISIQPLELLVVGYDRDQVASGFRIIIPLGQLEGVKELRKRGEFGASWIGQNDVLVRIIKGWGVEVKNLPSIKNLPEGQKKAVLEELDKQEYIINWGTMTIQDAVDFCVLAIETTAAIQRFSDGTKMNPGDFPGVGGAIDVAIITPEKGFVWLQKKKISVGENIVDLEKIESFEKLQQRFKKRNKK